MSWFRDRIDQHRATVTALVDTSYGVKRVDVTAEIYDVLSVAEVIENEALREAVKALSNAIQNG